MASETETDSRQGGRASVEENGRERKKGRALDLFFLNMGSRWRAVETRRGHAALGHTTRRPTPEAGRPLLLPLKFKFSIPPQTYN
jgi:hypothetical protein